MALQAPKPKRVGLWFLSFLFSECRSLFLFSNAGKQTKPIRFFSEGRSGVSGEAYIEGCAIVSRSN